MRHLLPPLIALVLVPTMLAQTPPPAAPPQPAVQTAPAAPANPGMYPRVKLETSLGNIVVELNGEKAPISTQNFIRYAEEGFYNGTIFHRVMKTFMIQGGGFTPDLNQKKEGLHEPIKNEWQNGLKNVRGTIAMARTNEPDIAPRRSSSSTSWTTARAPRATSTRRARVRRGRPHMPCSGVVEGMDIVNKIKDVPVQTSSKYPSPQPVVPVEPVVIKTVTLVSEYDRAKVDQLAGEQIKKVQEEQAKAEQEKEKAAQELVAKVEAETGKKMQKRRPG